MAIYFIIFSILVLFSALELYGLNHEECRKFFGLFSFCLFVLSFVRWETGTDWELYYSYFNLCVDWGLDYDFEWGFARINEFVKIFFDNFTLLLFVLGVILYAVQSSAILKLSPYPITSLLFLWSTNFANVFFVRQSIATVILFFSIRYIQEKNIFKFLLMIGLAMLFHRTSLIFIFAWWIYNLKLRPNVMLLFIFLSMLLTILLSAFIGGLGAIMGGVFQKKIEFYLENSSETFGGEMSLLQTIIKGFANKVFIFALSFYFLSKLENRGVEFRGYLNLYWMGIILYFSTISVSIALVRLSFAYDMVLILLIPIILKNVDRLYVKFSIFSVFFFYLVMRLYIAIAGNYYDEFVPFETIFN